MKILANLAEHIVAFGIERAHSEGIEYEMVPSRVYLAACTSRLLFGALIQIKE
jgi:hypothetical protein